MLELTSENVRVVVGNCLFSADQLPADGKPPSTAVVTEGVVRKFGFDPEKIAAQKPRIVELLSQLPDAFHKTKGGGMSFLRILSVLGVVGVLLLFWRRITDPVRCGGCRERDEAIMHLYRQLDSLGHTMAHDDDWQDRGIGRVR